MKFYPNHKLDRRQLRAVEMTQHILNTFEFEGWFINHRFTDMKNPPSLLNVEVVEQIFNRQQYRFSWELQKKPLMKKLFKKSERGYRLENKIVTYQEVYDRCSLAELCRIFARQIMHIVGFDEVDETVEPNRSVPYQVGEYVYASACRLTRMNE